MVLNVTLCAQYVIKDNKKGLRFNIHLFVCLFSWTRQFKHKLSDLDFPACLCDQWSQIAVSSLLHGHQIYNEWMNEWQLWLFQQQWAFSACDPVV